MGYFAAEKHVEIPTKDLLSWTFDEPRFDPNEPVVNSLKTISGLDLRVDRSISTLKIHRDPSLRTRRDP